MLTNIFYYNYYKPYIVKGVDTENSIQKKTKIYDKSQTETASNKSVFLNKALKTDIVKYARNVSSSVVGIKEASKNLLNDIDGFSKNVRGRGFSAVKGWIEEDLEDFVEKYNSETEFLSNQAHSQQLKDFSDISKEIVLPNIELLQNLGIEEAGGRLVFNKDRFDKLDQQDLYSAFADTALVFDNMYLESSNILSAPLSEHMSFKGLNYYYSYKMGNVVTESFKIIESGLLFDRVV